MPYLAPCGRMLDVGCRKAWACDDDAHRNGLMARCGRKRHAAGKRNRIAICPNEAYPRGITGCSITGIGG
jgi:hypothetical protein